MPTKNKVPDGECRDLGMLDGLQDYIDRQKGDILIVLHQMGNHGPAYYKRYPKEFERFTPVCTTSDLGSCTPEQIRNTYDNAILYTDLFLCQGHRTSKGQRSQIRDGNVLRERPWRVAR